MARIVIGRSKQPFLVVPKERDYFRLGCLGKRDDTVYALLRMFAPIDVVAQEYDCITGTDDPVNLGKQVSKSLVIPVNVAYRDGRHRGYPAINSHSLSVRLTFC